MDWIEKIEPFRDSITGLLDLSKADLIGTNLSRADLSGTNLSGADLDGEVPD